MVYFLNDDAKESVWRIQNGLSPIKPWLFLSNKVCIYIYILKLLLFFVGSHRNLHVIVIANSIQINPDCHQWLL